MKLRNRRKKQTGASAPVALRQPRITSVKPSPYRPCEQRGCTVLTAQGRCSAHTERAPLRGIRWEAPGG